MKRAAPLLVLLSAAGAAAGEWSVASPDGRRAIVLVLSAQGRLSWRVTSAGEVALADAPLGLVRADQSFLEGLRLSGASKTVALDERYETPHGKRRRHHVLSRQRTLAFTNAQGARLEVDLRAHDDGVAFRYRFPETHASPRTVTDERTAFGVPEGSRGWLLPHHMPSRYQPAYEDLFQEVAAGAPAPGPAGWSFPALFRTPGGTWVLLTEAGRDETYCGTRLAAQAPGGLYRIRFPDPGEGMGVGAVDPSSTLPWTLPWRVVILADRAARLLESDLVNDLSAPTRLEDSSWIRPGGAEPYTSSEAYARRAAWQHTVLAFTRNVPVVMDDTPVAFTPRKQPRRTTDAHELALAVVFVTGVQPFADSVEAYRALPEGPKAFLRQVPAAWEETRGLSGEPGRSVVVARRGGDAWYVGGLSGLEGASTATVDLSFLGPGAWTLTLIGDGAGTQRFDTRTRPVTARDVLEVPMHARGGFVLRITRD